MARGRSKAALRKAKKWEKSGHTYGQTSSSLFRKLKRKLRKLRKKGRHKQERSHHDDSLFGLIDTNRGRDQDVAEQKEKEDKGGWI